MTGLPFDLVNGTDADATQVMANFNYLLGLTNISLVAAQDMNGPVLIGINNLGAAIPATDTGTPAVGFLIGSVLEGATFFLSAQGLITGYADLTFAAPVFLSSAGGISEARPANGSGLYSQVVGWVASTSSIYFTPQAMNGPL